MFQVIIGLGNPGKIYEHTRHNWGFGLLDDIAKSENAEWKKAGFADAQITQVGFGGTKWLVKPQTYMNLSGTAVQACLHWWKCTLADALVLVDDVELPLGRLRLRAKGSSGGHNGLRSIEQCCGSNEFARLRGGVGREDGHTHLAGHVLGKFDKEEKEKVIEMNNKAKKVIEMLSTQGWGNTVQFANTNP